MQHSATTYRRMYKKKKKQINLSLNAANPATNKKNQMNECMIINIYQHT